MKVLKFLFGLVVLLALVVFGGGLLIDPSYTVSRSVVVKAPPDKVYAHIDSSQGWARWGVWYQRDPQMTVVDSGAPHGAGAAWSWKSASQGDGAMTLTAAEPGQRVAYQLSIDGFEPSQGDLVLTPEGDGTRVTWRMEGRMHNTIGRWFGLFMDSLVGPDFDAGLANLKLLAEKS